MKIAFDAGDILKNNGIGVYTRGLVTALASLFPGDEFCLVTNPNDAPRLRDAFSPFPNILIDESLVNILKFGKILKEPVKYINSKRWKRIACNYDLVHQANQFRMIKGIDNLVATVHDLIPLYGDEDSSEKIRRNYRKKISLLIDEAKLIFVPTEFVKNEFARFFPGNNVNIVTTYEGTGGEFRKTEAPCSFWDKYYMFPDSKYFLHVSRLYRRKNAVSIVKAFSKLRESNSDLYLLLVVNGSAEEKKHFYQSCGSMIDDDYVKILEGISLDELIVLYSCATGFVFPSWSEGFGLPLLEAMKCGCPVITSTVSCLPEVAGDAALLVNPGDIEEIRSAMELLLNNPATGEELRAKGYKRTSELTWENAAILTHEGYRTALNRGGS